MRIWVCLSPYSGHDCVADLAAAFSHDAAVSRQPRWWAWSCSGPVTLSQVIVNGLVFYIAAFSRALCSEVPRGVKWKHLQCHWPTQWFSCFEWLNSFLKIGRTYSSGSDVKIGRRASLWHNWAIVQFSRSVMSDSLRPHGLQHTRPPCPSPTPRVYPNSCPLSRWCHPTISSSVVPFSSCLQSFPALGSFPMSQLFASGGQNIGVSSSASVLPKNIQDWSPLGWTGWISLEIKLG